ncbi:general transcription factor IIF subunit 2-like isoform X1 [Clytia hemisphaerica]|uniref:General transcription factor IIF subunit 2 n=1 Tax=Clytia hemisphaerica TaxID=252671 RepID=A0A7M5V399_9CNID|eukprot:TCONS_00050113-protein
MMTSNTPTNGGSGSSTKVDCTRANQNVWLVKVPKYMAEVWSKADGSGIVGSLRIPVNSGPNNVSFHLAQHLTKLGESGDIPEKHKFVMSDFRQTMGVFSETPPDEDEPSESTRDKIAFEGTISKRIDCRPIQSTAYMSMKMTDIKKALKPKRTTVFTDEKVSSFRPVNDHSSMNEQAEKKRSTEKRVRSERDEVLETIFSAFEKHQYYTLKDLIGITRQPVTHLKSILRDVCNYNLKNPHKNTYELKPEYRHYNKSDDTSESS